MNRNLALTLAALALAACSPDFDPASKVDKLRVLAIRADPPEIEPAGPGTVAPDRATLETLVVRGDFDAEVLRTTTVVHLACVPVPGDPAATPCVMLANLRDPAEAIAAGAQQACASGGSPGASPWPEIDLAGIEECASGGDVPNDLRKCGPASAGGVPLPPPTLAVPAALTFPPDGPARILGVQAVVLAFALDATAEELVAGVGTTCPAGDVAANLARLWPAREHVLATKQVTIRGPAALDPPNANPDFEEILATNLLDPALATTLDPALATTVTGGSISLSPKLLPELVAPHEAYSKLYADGSVQEATREEWVYSWFATAGEIEDLHTRDGESDTWTVAGAPGGARAVVAAVVRDLRGGTAWKVREVRIVP